MAMSTQPDPLGLKHVSEMGFKCTVAPLWRWALKLDPPDARVPSLRFNIAGVIRTHVVRVRFFVCRGRTDVCGEQAATVSSSKSVRRPLAPS